MKRSLSPYMPSAPTTTQVSLPETTPMQTNAAENKSRRYCAIKIQDSPTGVEQTSSILPKLTSATPFSNPDLKFKLDTDSGSQLTAATGKLDVKKTKGSSFSILDMMQTLSLKESISSSSPLIEDQEKSPTYALCSLEDEETPGCPFSLDCEEKTKELEQDLFSLDADDLENEKKEKDEDELNSFSLS